MAQVATKQFIVNDIVGSSTSVKSPLSTLSNTRCPTYQQLLNTKSAGYPINIDSSFIEFVPEIMAVTYNGVTTYTTVYIQKATNYTSNMLVCQKSIHKSSVTNKTLTINLYNTSNFGYANSTGTYTYLNDIMYDVVDQYGIDAALPCEVKITSLVVGTQDGMHISNNLDISGTTFTSGEANGKLGFSDENPYKSIYTNSSTLVNGSKIYIMSILTIYPSTYSTSTTNYTIEILIKS